MSIIRKLVNVKHIFQFQYKIKKQFIFLIKDKQLKLRIQKFMIHIDSKKFIIIFKEEEIMVNIFIALALGIILGFLLSNKKKVILLSEKIINPIIYILLFSMGLSIGKNKRILENFVQIGKNAFFLAFFSLLGTAFLLKISKKRILNEK